MRIVALSVAIAGASVLAWGCSGAIAPFHPGSDAGSDGTPPGDDCVDCDAQPPPLPDAGPGPACPATQPAPGTPCTRESLECEYGTSQYPGCDVIVQCSAGYWGTAFGPAGFCPTGPNPDGCPASMSGVGVGGVCPQQGLTCHYALGQCYCGLVFGPPVQPQDGGPPPTWSCDDPGPGCPQPRPRVGAPCTQEGQSCQYLACDWAQQCTGGVWQAQPEGCAQAGGASP